MQYLYLDAVHMDIAFGDCLAIGGFQYALILVDRGTWYNWTFSLKTLSLDCILLALRLFRALLVPLQNVSIVTAIPSFLGLPLASISSIMTPKSSLPLPSISRQMALLNPIGR
jgi:hypothetical protein